MQLLEVRGPIESHLRLQTPKLITSSHKYTLKENKPTLGRKNGIEFLDEVSSGRSPLSLKADIRDYA